VVRLTAVDDEGKSSSAELTITVQSIVRAVPARRAFGRYWPTHSAGDCDFASHGPRTYMDAVLRANSDGSKLIVDLHMKATETQYDWSSAEGTWSQLVYVAPAGTRIVNLPSVTELHEGYVDNDHAYAQSAGNPMGYFYWAGDTDGDDICGTTTDDTNMTFYLNPLSVRLTPR